VPNDVRNGDTSGSRRRLSSTRSIRAPAVVRLLVPLLVCVTPPTY